LTAPGPGDPAAVDGAAARVARNTFVRGAAELAAKFASLALMAVLAREEGPARVGVLIFALAWCEIAMAPVDMGFDRYFLRRVAGDRAELDRCFFNVVALKLGRAVPAIAVSWALVSLLGYDGDTRVAVYLLTLAYLLDTLSYTVYTAFNGVERGDLAGVALAVQRLTTAGIGVGALLAGYGVVTVAAAFVAGSTVGLITALALLARKVHMPRRALPRGPRRDLRRQSVPFAAQELLSIGVSRIDVLLLSALATQTVVGYYGLAYRLLEATLFIPTALQGAFAAMYTYLHEHTEPTIRAVFQRSVKLLLVLLVPCAVPLAVLPGELIELLFGDGFGDATEALRLLAPTVVLVGLVMLTGSLISSRLNPRILVVYFGVALVVNVAMNVLLIPSLGATGAALAMLTTELCFVVLTLRIAVRSVGGIDVVPTLGGPLVAGAAMALMLAALHAVLPVALAAGALAYLGVLVAVERRLAPADLAFVTGMVRDRLPRRPSYSSS
jgi:O-antigen/teichoic acid export membrane protein